MESIKRTPSTGMFLLVIWIFQRNVFRSGLVIYVAKTIRKYVQLCGSIIHPFYVGINTTYATYNHTRKEEIKNRWCRCMWDMIKSKFVPCFYIHAYSLTSLFDARGKNIDASVHPLRCSSDRGPYFPISESIYGTLPTSEGFVKKFCVAKYVRFGTTRSNRNNICK